MADETIFPLPSLREKVSPEEWRTRVDLAACYRLFDLYGLSDMTANHISARVPGEDAYLINPYGMLYEEMTASCFIKVDDRGEITYAPDFGSLKYGLYPCRFRHSRRDPRRPRRHRLRRAHAHSRGHGSLCARLRCPSYYADGDEICRGGLP